MLFKGLDVPKKESCKLLCRFTSDSSFIKKSEQQKKSLSFFNGITKCLRLKMMILAMGLANIAQNGLR
jgi:hypothetical protein